MLIVYKFNFKLLTIWFFLVLRRGEKLHNVVFGKQGKVVAGTGTWV